MSLTPVHRYEDGPTACRPSSAVLKDIKRSIKASHALSSADVRLASFMGQISRGSPKFMLDKKYDQVSVLRNADRLSDFLKHGKDQGQPIRKGKES